MIECRNAVPANHGMMAEFSTGSQPQYPPAELDVRPVRGHEVADRQNMNGTSAHFRMAVIHSVPSRPVIRAAIANANGTDQPTYPR